MLETITQFDGNLLIKIQDFLVHDAITPAVQFITELGNKGYIWIAIVLLLLIWKKTRKAAFVVAVCLALEFILNDMILKVLIARARPYVTFPAVQLLVERQSDYSFPSGHAASSFAVAVAMLRLMPKRLGIPALVLAIAIALSRLYVGVHYPLDVLAGAGLGTVVSMLVTSGAKDLTRFKK